MLGSTKPEEWKIFLDIHVQAFNSMGGIHRELVYDNLKQAVRKFVGRNEKKQLRT